MKRLNEKYVTITCPSCQEIAKKTDWLPPRGYDPHMRMFKCSKCQLEIYVEVTTEMTRTEELAGLNKD